VTCRSSTLATFGSASAGACGKARVSSTAGIAAITYAPNLSRVRDLPGAREYLSLDKL
jgi:hypothetical protein